MNSNNLINEQNIDGALNSLFLIEFSRKTDEKIARFVMEQEYDVKIDADKESKLIARLRGGKSGWNYFLILLGLGFISVSLMLLLANKQSSEQIGVAQKTEVFVQTNNESQPIANGEQGAVSREQLAGSEEQEKTLTITPTQISYNNYSEPNPPANTEVKEPAPFVASPAPEEKNEPQEVTELPFFNKAGLAHYAKVKEQMLLKIVKIDDKLYAKTEPGATYYKSREVLVAPYVMSQHPVTNLQYKTFLADLAMQGRIDDLKKCLPKAEVWKEYGCIALAKNYFEGETYNDFPVVNIEKEATILFCEWLEIETNAKLAEMAEVAPASKTSAGKFKAPVKKKKQVVVRLPYDYEWIYSAEAAFSLCPDCGDGYNTIYDPTEGLVDKNFSKRNSQISAKGKRKLNRMDELCDINRFGMTEAEMLAIFQEAINFKPVKNAYDPAMYPGNIDAHTTAGHVCELIKQKDGGMTVRGCCWKNKDEYNKMMDSFKKNGASPFIGFRVAIQNSERGSDKNPFW